MEQEANILALVSVPRRHAAAVDQTSALGGRLSLAAMPSILSRPIATRHARPPDHGVKVGQRLAQRLLPWVAACHARASAATTGIAPGARPSDNDCACPPCPNVLGLFLFPAAAQLPRPPFQPARAPVPAESVRCPLDVKAVPDRHASHLGRGSTLCPRGRLARRAFGNGW